MSLIKIKKSDSFEKKSCEALRSVKDNREITKEHELKDIKVTSAIIKVTSTIKKVSCATIKAKLAISRLS